MKINTRRVGSQLVLDIQGHVKGSDVSDFKALVQECIRNKDLQLVANFQHVGFIDSSGVGMLIHCLQELRNNGGDLRLVNLSEDIHDLFEMVAIDRFFTILHNEKEIESLP